MSRILTIARIVWVEMLRRKDFYVLLILLGVLMFSLMTVNVFGLGSTPRYMVDSGLLLTWLCSLILAVTLTGRQLPREEQRGTIYSLLAKPVSRWELIVGKWFGSWFAVLFATVLFYSLIVLMLLLKQWHVNVVVLLQALLLHGMALSIVVSLTLALSTRTSFGAAATLAFVILGAGFVFVPQIPVVAVHAAGISATAMRVIYYALPHFELFDMRQCVVHDWPAVKWGVIFSILLYGAVVTSIFLLLAWLGYRNKRFKRGAAD